MKRALRKPVGSQEPERTAFEEGRAVSFYAKQVARRLARPRPEDGEKVARQSKHSKSK